MDEQKIPMDLEQIKKVLPHRYPFLLIDRVLDFRDHESLIALKNVTANEEFFQGHFPGRPVMPGVLILEAMAQAGAIMARSSTNGVDPKKTVFLVGIDDAKFKRQVIPGDSLIIEMHSIRRRPPLWVMTGSVTVEGKLVASATITAAEAN